MEDLAAFDAREVRRAAAEKREREGVSAEEVSVRVKLKSKVILSVYFKEQIFGGGEERKRRRSRFCYPKKSWIKCINFPMWGKFCTCCLGENFALVPKFCTPRSLSPTLYTPFQCTLPRIFTYRACPFGVHCLPLDALC